VDRQTVDPADGSLRRDAQGGLTGILVEGAMALVSRAIPREHGGPPRRWRLPSNPWRYGLTGVHDFDGQLRQALHDASSAGWGCAFEKDRRTSDPQRSTFGFRRRVAPSER
jgi:predicted amidohydrolase YtcJ